MPATDPATDPAAEGSVALSAYAAQVREAADRVAPSVAGRLLDAGLGAADPTAPTLEALADRAMRAAVPLAVGKAAVPMARAWQAWGGPPGVVVGPRRADAASLVGWEVRWGEHPVPGATSYAAGKRLLDLVREGLDAVLLISGGASAMADAPVHGLAEDAHRRLADRLWRQGLPIAELNAARSLLSRLKAGGLQAEAERAGVRLEVLFASDVPGDDAALVGSGPAVRVEPATLEDRVRAAGLPDDLTEQVLDAGRARPDPPADSAPHTCVLPRRAPVDAMTEAALGEDRGATVVCVDGPVEEAAERAAEAARGLEEDEVLLLWGEPEVRLDGDAEPGRGGRATHLLLALWTRLAGGQAGGAGGNGADGDATFAGAVVATDGRDGAAEAAGGVARFDPSRADAAADALERYDSAAFLEALPPDVGGLVEAADPGANSADLGVVVRM